MKRIRLGSGKILAIMILAYIIILSLITVTKYLHFGYNELDLAIFTQTFFNTANGRWFAMTIHPQTYLTDHFEPLILPLSLIYRFAPSAITLLILQTIVLALAAVPLFFITRHILSRWAIVIPLLYLVNPFTLNINLDGFHMVSLIPLMFFSVYCFYLKRRFVRFTIFLVLSAFVREDVALMVPFFGVLAFIDIALERRFVFSQISDVLRQNLKWILTPIIVGLVWFAVSMRIIDTHAIDEGYKFSVYYSWLGESYGEMIRNVLIHPVSILAHMITIPMIEMILGMLMPFLIFPLLRARYLILAAVPFLGIILSEPGGSEIVIDTHYVAFFLPALFLAFLYGLREFFDRKHYPKFLDFFFRESALTKIILGITTMYGFIFLGPLVFGSVELSDLAQRQHNSMIDEIKRHENVVTTYRYLPRLASREKVYGLNYLLIGKTQFAEADFPLPDDVDVVYVDFDEIITYRLQYQDKKLYRPYYQDSDVRFRQLLDGFGLVSMKDNVAFFRKDAADSMKLYRVLDFYDTKNYTRDGTIVGGKIRLVGYKRDDQNLSLYWQAFSEMDHDYQLRMSFENDSGKIERYVPLVYGMFETSDWTPDEILEVNYALDLPEKFSLSIVDIKKGAVEITPLRAIHNVYDEVVVLEPSIHFSPQTQ